MRLAYERYSGETRLHPRPVPGDRERGRRDRPLGLVRQGPGDDRGARLRRGPRLVRPPVQAGRGREGQGEEAPEGLARPDDQARGRPADGHAGQARDARLRGGLQRRRRDRRHRRRAGPARALVQADGAVPPRREGLGPGRPPRAACSASTPPSAAEPASQSGWSSTPTPPTSRRPTARPGSASEGDQECSGDATTEDTDHTEGREADR